MSLVGIPAAILISKITHHLVGELDRLMNMPNTHTITCPVFGRPEAADKAQLILCMSGDYRSKKEVAYILVPAIGKKVIDLGGNLQKGALPVDPPTTHINVRC